MLNKKFRTIKCVIGSLLVLTLTSSAMAGSAETVEEKIARAITAAPADITKNATIMDVDGAILRKGTNEWVCFPGVGLIPGDKHPMCNDKVWMKWMKAVSTKTPFTTDVIGVSYMLAGDALVNNDNPMATDPNDGGVWVQDGPHLMMLFPNKDMISSLPRNPFVGGPYVMWDKTPLVHVMVPIEAKVAPKK